MIGLVMNVQNYQEDKQKTVTKIVANR